MRNGLYSIHIEMLDGVKGRATGIIILRDGRLFGGDSYFYYTGHYLLSGPGKWKGELSPFSIHRASQSGVRRPRCQLRVFRQTR